MARRKSHMQQMSTVSSPGAQLHAEENLGLERGTCLGGDSIIAGCLWGTPVTKTRQHRKRSGDRGAPGPPTVGEGRGRKRGDTDPRGKRRGIGPSLCEIKWAWQTSENCMSDITLDGSG